MKRLTRNRPTTTGRGQGTRLALLDAAAELFARHGFDGVSNRPIAAAAGVNQALIGYHFGGKEGLYLAVIERVASDLRGRIGSIATMLESQVDDLADNLVDGQVENSHDQCVEMVTTLLSAHVKLLMDPGVEQHAKLIIREQLEPTPAFKILWDGLLGRILLLLTRLVTLSQGRSEPTSDDRLLALTLVGQVLVFRVARATVMHHMQWPDEPGEDEVAKVDTRIRANIQLLLGVSSA